MTIDEQKIAIRLSRRITVVSKRLKRFLNLHNASSEEDVSLEEATNPTDCIGYSYTPSSVPDFIKYQAVRLCHQNDRAVEELSHLETEMKNCIEHYISENEHLTRQREPIQCSGALDSCGMGTVCLLTQRIKECKDQIA